jgi:hypothetical protein
MTTKQNKILHTRVSKDLYSKISDKAKKHRVTVSNLVRNLVEDYFEIHNEVLDVVDREIREHLDNNENILGYQPITLEKNTSCNICGEKLQKGEGGFIGFFENSNKKIVVCQKCR